jgi:23S rRNA pseudouridine1911/1915/1917 synthase
MNIEILFENDEYLVINKPSGLVVHADGKTPEPTVVDWIREHYPSIKGVGENMVIQDKEGNEITIERPGIVHRIDRDTSGCLVIAKNENSFQYLKQQFQEHQVQKSYLALVYGNIKQDSGSIDAPIGKNRGDFRMKDAGPHARGTLREAHTDYRVIERYENLKKFDKQRQTPKYTFVELYPKTGRTHQIRVHLKHFQYPIVSDSLYAGKRKPELGLTRTALHSSKISFTDSKGNPINVQAPLAEDIKQALELLSVRLM